jgi:hypothetical protein
VDKVKQRGSRQKNSGGQNIDSITSHRSPPIGDAFLSLSLI